MKTTLLHCLFGMCLTCCMQAQNGEIRWGVQQDLGGSKNVYFPLGVVGGNFYTMQIDGKDGNFIKVDDKMNIDKPVAVSTGEKKIDVDLVFQRNNELNLVSSNYESGEKTNHVRVNSYSLNGKATEIKLKKISSVKVERNTEKSDFQYYFSNDSSKLLIVHEHDMKSSDDAKITLTVVNTDDFSEDWKTVSDFPYEDKDFAFLNATVSNNGAVVLLSTIKGDEGKKLEKYSTHAFAFSDKSQSFSEKTLKLEGKYISSAFLKFVSNDKLFLTGFYNDLKSSGSNEGIEGAFIGSAEISDIEGMRFELETLKPETKAAITKTGALAKLFGGDELNAYQIRDFTVNADGSGYVIAEQQYIVQSETQTSATRTYYFNHLIIYRFDDQQHITTMSVVPKQQSTSISATKVGIGPLTVTIWAGYVVKSAYKYNSFTSIDKDGDIYILYNDHVDNGDARTLKETKTMSNKNKALATLVKLDAKGDWEKTQLFRGKDLNVILDPASSYGIDGKGFVIGAERGNNLQFGMLEL